jgi:polyferredoxin
VRNGYTLKVSNKTHEARALVLTLEGLPGATAMRVGGETDGAAPVLPIGPDQVAGFRVFVTVPPGAVASEATQLTMVVSDPETGARAVEATAFRGPAR